LRDNQRRIAVAVALTVTGNRAACLPLAAFLYRAEGRAHVLKGHLHWLIDRASPIEKIRAAAGRNLGDSLQHSRLRLLRGRTQTFVISEVD
jgi:hypothetical protein